MKNLLLLLISISYFSISQAQNISFELTSEGVLQQADVGDMEFGDIDNDGDLDLLVTGAGPGIPVTTTLYENDGNGNFTEIIGTSLTNMFGGKVGFIDVDGDGFMDILMTGQALGLQKKAELYINDQTGNFSLVSGTQFEPCTGGNFDFVDVNNDTFKDLILSGYDTNDLGFTKLYLNDGTANFTEDTGVPFLDLAGGDVRFIDMENDNDPDVLLVGEDDGGVKHSVLYTNDGAGNFSLVTGTTFDNCSGGDIDVGDSDNDGDIDIIISGTNDNNDVITKIYLNNGTGSFSLASAVFPGVRARGETHFADFDADGDEDIFILGSGPGGLFGPGGFNAIIANVYENLGGNNFMLADSLIGAYISTAAIGDIDGDNDLDIAIGGTSVGQPTRATRLYTNTNTGEVNMGADRFCLTLLANPTMNTFKIEGFIEDYTIEILDASGNLFQTLTTGFNKIIIDITTLPAGQHFIKVQNISDPTILIEKILKN